MIYEQTAERLFGTFFNDEEHSKFEVGQTDTRSSGFGKSLYDSLLMKASILEPQSVQWLPG